MSGRRLSQTSGPGYAAMLRTSDGKEVVAANLNRLIRKRAAENEMTIAAYVVDNVLPNVVHDRDGTIFLLSANRHRGR